MSYTRKCAYCGRWFEAKRPHATYCKDRCRTNAWERDGFDAEQEAAQRVEGDGAHPLQAVREEQEASKEKARWTLMAREHLARTLLATGYAHADDFDALGIPDDHRNVIGSQMGSFVQRGLMVEISRRASANPRRKSAKSAVYQLTAKGREQLSTLVGSSSGAPGGTGVATARSGESSGVGPTPQHKLGAFPPVGADTDAGSPDSLVQLDGGRKASSMYDPYEGQAA